MINTNLVQPWTALLRSLCSFFNLHGPSLRRFFSLIRDWLFPFWRPQLIPRATTRWPRQRPQRDQQGKAFVDSISRTAIATLASRHNGNRPCIVSNDIRHGSYNVCLFVTFPDDNTRWVVRLPMPPMLADEWSKLQSEVATMRHVQRNTTIPIPRIHAYGKGECLTNDRTSTQSFLIMDEMPGKALDLDALCSSATDIQDRFYSQFVGVLAQLHELNFTETGSLYPDTADEDREIIGPSLFLNENDVNADTGTHREAAGALYTTMDVIKQLYDVLDRAFDMPAIYEDPLELRLQVFARKSLTDLLPNFCHSSPNRQQLALSHGDLRCDNILVDDEFRIQAILDWEWVNILPQQFCVPPVWICGLDTDMEDDTSDPSQVYGTRDKIFEAFQRAAAAYDEYNRWLKFWTEDQLRLPISFILRCPHYLIPIYSAFIYPTMYEVPFEDLFPILFAFDETLRKKLERQQETSQQLENYLRREGLHVLDEYDELRYS